MKKKITYAVLALVTVSSGIYITLTYNHGKATGKVQVVQAAPKAQKSTYVICNAELAKAAQSVGEITDEQTLNFRMMEMSFQKITFKGNNLRIPGTRNPNRVQMTKENIQYIKNNLHVINDERRPDYESILNEWYDGNFKAAVEDFYEIQDLRRGPRSEPRTKSEFDPVLKTDSDEKEYILHFFGQEGLDIHNKQWDKL
ncbi:DUF6241 domain-containing protein [Microbacteriaceae bacterium 4G12]